MVHGFIARSSDLFYIYFSLALHSSHQKKANGEFPCPGMAQVLWKFFCLDNRLHTVRAGLATRPMTDTLFEPLSIPKGKIKGIRESDGLEKK